jgi:acetylornithine deacetylase/succinyl-diaminopimelate desuccinylase-like protein
MMDDMTVDAATLDEVTSLLSDLVAIPSVNPAFRADGDAPEIFGEGGLCAVLAHTGWCRRQASAGFARSPKCRGNR